jgi:hypothetical protein
MRVSPDWGAGEVAPAAAETGEPEGMRWAADTPVDETADEEEDSSQQSSSAASTGMPARSLPGLVPMTAPVPVKLEAKARPKPKVPPKPKEPSFHREPIKSGGQVVGYYVTRVSGRQKYIELQDVRPNVLGVYREHADSTTDGKGMLLGKGTRRSISPAVMKSSCVAGSGREPAPSGGLAPRISSCAACTADRGACPRPGSAARRPGPGHRCETGAEFG